MKIKDVMSAPPVVVPSITAVRDVAQHMDHSGVGCVLVVDEGRLVGMITDRDLALRVLAKGLSGDTTAGTVMTPRPVTVHADADIDVALRAFRRNEFRRLPVTVDDVGDEIVVGMIAVDDLLLQLSRFTQDLLGPVGREILEPQHQTA